MSQGPGPSRFRRMVGGLQRAGAAVGRWSRHGSRALRRLTIHGAHRVSHSATGYAHRRAAAADSTVRRMGRDVLRHAREAWR